MFDLNTYNGIIMLSEEFEFDFIEIYNYYKEIKELSYFVNLLFQLNNTFDNISYFIRENPKEVEERLNQTIIVYKKFKLTYHIINEKIVIGSLRNCKFEK